MTTDTPAAWTAWRGRHLELAIACEEAAIVAFTVQGSTERTWTAAQYKLDAARAALEAHLDAVPMPQVEADALENQFEAELERLKWDSDNGGARETMKVFAAFRTVVSPLYRHPKSI